MLQPRELEERFMLKGDRLPPCLPRRHQGEISGRQICKEIFKTGPLVNFVNMESVMGYRGKFALVRR